MAEVSLVEWKKFLEKQTEDVHLQQMGEWGELSTSIGWKVVRIVSDDSVGAQIIFSRQPLGLTLAYLPKPVFSKRLNMDGKDPALDQFWKEVDKVCKKRRSVFLKMEPDAWDNNYVIKDSSFIRSWHNNQPARTIVVDIAGDKEAILARMKPKCRYNIRLAQKKGVTVRPWNDIPGFYNLLAVTGKRDGFTIHPIDYYHHAYELFYPTGKGEILVAEFEGKPLAAVMLFSNGRRAWYSYGATSDEERSRMPMYLLQWEAMCWAKEQGCEEYDMYGIPDEEEHVLEANFEAKRDRLWGVYRFKRGFGGEIKRSVQAYDRVYNPLAYRLYLWRRAMRGGW